MDFAWLTELFVYALFHKRQITLSDKASGAYIGFSMNLPARDWLLQHRFVVTCRDHLPVARLTHNRAQISRHVKLGETHQKRWRTSSFSNKTASIRFILCAKRM
jgi:hypothetical protein